jgi:hypothetical protein
MTKQSWIVMLCGLALGLSSLVRAQNSNSGDIRGTVTDSSGAVVPGVEVTVTNNDTGVLNKYVTNGSGLYDTNSIIPGNYTLEFSKQGFEKFKRGPIPLQVGFFTVDVVLSVGSATQVVVVNSDVALLKTEDAQVTTTLQEEQLANLPNVDPEAGYAYLLKLLPGSASTANSMSGGNGGGAGDQEPQFDQVINGTMPYFSSFLVDGGSIWLPHSANTDQGLSESVSEVNVIATDAPAQYGGGGSVFNVITKSGGNQFHGALYDYFQNDDLNARSYYNTGAKAKQRYNYFGGAVGGPILKNKMFFYYNYQQLKNPNSSFSKASEPTLDMKAGCFDPALFGTSLKLDAAHGGAPLTTNPAQCGAFNAADLAIPTADFDPVAVNIQNDLYVNPNLPGLSNNIGYLAPGNNNQIKMVGRLDYNIVPANRVSFSIVSRWAPDVVALNDGGNAPNCPVDCHNQSSDGGNEQISDVWTISPNVVNEFRFSGNREADYYSEASLGEGYPAKLGLKFSTADVLPTVNFSGTGAPSSISPGTEALFIQNSFLLGDMATWVKGKHILHFGGELLMEQDNSTPWGGINGATLAFTGQYTTSNPAVEVGYADFLLGDVQLWNTNTTPKHYMRAKNPSFFAQDDFKITKSLTINLGVRSETHVGAIEKYNNAGGFDPTLADPVASTPALPTNPLGSIWFAGQNGARNQSYATKTLVMPRLGFAWQLTNNWVFRGGVGQYASLWSEDTVGGTMGFGSGSIGSASSSSTTTPVVQLSGSGANLPILTGAAARNPLSYITPASPQGSGGIIPYTPYHLPIQNGWQWTAGVQRRLPGNMVAEAQYVGSHWDNMMFEADVNQLPASKLGQGQSARPYPQFSGIGVGSGGSRTGTYNGISNYQSAQFMLHVPTNHGLAAELSYTWSRLYDDMDDSGWGNQFGNVYYQDAYNPSANYGPSNFDRPNSFKGTVLYALPFGKGHQYLSSTLADTVLGGWTASGDFLAESGVPFTVIMNSSVSDGSLGGNGGDGNSAAVLYPNRTGNPGSGGQSHASWFNQLAYAAPAENTYGTNPRNSLRAPDLTDIDFSLAKSWRLPGWERGKVQLRIDAIDLPNHPSFAPPTNALNPTALATQTPDPSVGQITGTTINGRTVQLTGRFEF